MMATGLERIIQHRDFQSLDYPQQVGLISNILNQVSPDLASDPEKLTSFAERQIRIHRPRTAFERIGSFVSGFIPVAGPLIQQYAFDEEVTPPGLLTSFGIVDDDNPYGALIRAGLDVPLMLAGGVAGGAIVGGVSRYLPALANRTLPALIGRELIAGAASGTGELVLDPPQSIPEAGARLGLSAIGQAAVTTAGRKLFGRDARFERALKRELGDEGLTAFNNKADMGRLTDITDFELAAHERALGERKDGDAVKMRGWLSSIKQRRDQELEIRVEMEREAAENLAIDARAQARDLRGQLSRQTMEDRLREEELAGQETNAMRQAGSQYAAEQDALRRSRLIQDSETEFRQFANEQTAERIAFENQRSDQALEASYFRFVEQDADRLRQQRSRLEKEREAAIDSMIKQVERGPVERGDQQFLASERQLINLLEDRRSRGEAGARFPFVNDEPVTLPMGMIQDLGNGQSRGVIVERISQNRADLRYLGAVDRRTLRLPRDDTEQRIVGRLSLEQKVGLYPDFEKAKTILEARVEAERLTRLASLESRRFNAENADVQREIFGLRRGAALKYLEAHNAEIEPGTINKLRQIRGLDDRRRVFSVDELGASDAEALGKSLRSAGFENIRASLAPNGTFSVVASNVDSPHTQQATALFSRSTTFKGTIDPTSTATYSGLTPNEHSIVGKAFGLSEKQVGVFNAFADHYTRELRDRGIRFPTTVEALGVDEIGEQIGKGLKKPQQMRSDIIARSAEDVRRIDAGDVIEYQGSKGRVQLYVAGKEQTFNPDNSGKGTITYQTTPMEYLAEAQQNASGLPTIPLTELQLKEMGAKRSIEFPVATELGKFSLESPARNMGELFGVQRSAMPLPTVNATAQALHSAGSDLGFKVVVAKDGKVRLSGHKLDLSDLSMEDASLMLTRLKQFQQDRATMMSFFEGCQ